MRVLWLSHMVPYPPVSGALQRAYHLLAGVAARHEVTLLTFTQRRLLATETALAAARRALEEVCRRVVVHPIPAEASRIAWAAAVAGAGLSTRPFAARRFASAAYAGELGRLAAETRFDLLHVDTIGLAPYAAAAGPVPVALDHHNVESHLAARRAAAERNPLALAYLAGEAAKLRRLEGRHARLAAVNLVCSALDGARLAAVAPGARIAVCPNGTDPAAFAPVPGLAEPGRLLFLGGLSWHPNARGLRWFLREVWPGLVRAWPEVTLTVVGGDPPAAVTRAAAADGRIRLAGQVPDVRPYFDQAEVFVCPILDGGGTRLKVLDALAMAKPIVATTLGCEGLDLEPERHFLAGDTPEAFGRQVVRLLGDARLRAALAEAGRRLVVERYAWDRIVERVLAAYEEATSGAAGRPPAPPQVRGAGRGS